MKVGTEKTKGFGFGAVLEGGLAGIKNRVDGYGCGPLPGCQRMTSEIFQYAMQSW